MKFFKENSYDVIRLFINQIGIAIFSMIIYTAVAMVDINSKASLGIKVAVSAFAMLFYFSLLYTVAWDWGAKDKIRIDGGRLEPIKLKGARIALLANIPNFVLSFVSALTWGLHVLGVKGVQGVSALFNTFTRLLMSMYLGLLQGAFVWLSEKGDVYQFGQAVGYFFIPILAIAVTQFGYSFGLKEKKIFPTNSSKQKKA